MLTDKDLQSLRNLGDEAAADEIERLRAAYEQAMTVLRQIAAMPRRTREQRLANACVQFLDAPRPNDRIQPRR